MATKSTTKSADLFARAQELIPGGVNSPARAFKAVGGSPIFIARAKGALLHDVDGNSYLDFVGSWGPMILGHQQFNVVNAVERQAIVGTSYGAPTELEVRMAELIVEMVPSVEMVRMVNSGTEACMSAIRLARAATGRELIVKFEGCYHGHSDAFLAKAGSGLATLGEPTSPGVPAATAAMTLNAQFNDLESVEKIFAARGGNIAGLIVEPVVGNMGCVPPEEGFLEGLRAITTKHGAVLIFDEVMTGFRVSEGGAQERFGVMPDLTCLGKIIGGGLPVGAYGGRRDLMQLVSPAGPMYQAGTLSGNPLAMAAGIAQLSYIQKHPEIYEQLEEDGRVLESAVLGAIAEQGLPVTMNRVGSMGTVFFSGEKVTSWDGAARCDTARFARYFRFLLNHGIYMPCSQFESWFHSTAHTTEDIEGAANSIVRAIGHAFE